MISPSEGAYRLMGLVFPGRLLSRIVGNAGEQPTGDGLGRLESQPRAGKRAPAPGGGRGVGGASPELAHLLVRTD